MFKRIILPIIIVLGLIVLMINKLGSNKEKMQADAAIGAKKRTLFPVTVTTLKRDEISQDFELNGTFIPDHSLHFSADVSGRVKTLSIENGQRIAAGSLIAKVDGEQLNIDLKLAQLTLSKAQSDLSKYETMLKSNAVSKQQVEEAKLVVERAESTVSTLKRQVSLTTIKAPIAGVVSNLSIEKGSFLAPGTPIADIIDISNLKMNVHLRDDQVIRVKEGQTVSVKPDIYSNTVLKGKVVYIAPEADNSKKYAVEIQLSNPTKTPLKSGMTGKVLFEFGEKKTALTLPLDCLVGGVQNPKVYIVEGTKVRLVPVQIGARTDNSVEIQKGIDQRTAVVQTGQLNLSNGSTIQIISNK